MLKNSLLKLLADSVIFFTTEIINISSENNFGLDAKSSDKLLMYIRTHNGPSIEPCGIPASVEAQEVYCHKKCHKM